MDLAPMIQILAVPVPLVVMDGVQDRILQRLLEQILTDDTEQEIDVPKISNLDRLPLRAVLSATEVAEQLVEVPLVSPSDCALVPQMGAELVVEVPKTVSHPMFSAASVERSSTYLPGPSYTAFWDKAQQRLVEQFLSVFKAVPKDRIQQRFLELIKSCSRPCPKTGFSSSVWRSSKRSPGTGFSSGRRSSRFSCRKELSDSSWWWSFVEVLKDFSAVACAKVVLLVMIHLLQSPLRLQLLKKQR